MGEHLSKKDSRVSKAVEFPFGKAVYAVGGEESQVESLEVSLFDPAQLHPGRSDGSILAPTLLPVKTRKKLLHKEICP